MPFKNFLFFYSHMLCLRALHSHPFVITLINLSNQIAKQGFKCNPLITKYVQHIHPFSLCVLLGDYKILRGFGEQFFKLGFNARGLLALIGVKSLEIPY